MSFILVKCLCNTNGHQLRVQFTLPEARKRGKPSRKVKVGQPNCRTCGTLWPHVRDFHYTCAVRAPVGAFISELHLLLPCFSHVQAYPPNVCQCLPHVQALQPHVWFQVSRTEILLCFCPSNSPKSKPKIGQFKAQNLQKHTKRVNSTSKLKLNF